jgi:NDP-sugar pyrophosphorylase family protein
MSLDVAVLAGGLATRLGPLAAGRPKILIEVGGRPFAERQLEWLRDNGVSRVVYCVGHLGEQVEAALGGGSRWGMSLEYVSDGPGLLGTGGALRHALPRLGDAFFALYGDSYLTCRLPPIEEAFRKSGKAGLMTVFLNSDRWDRSNVVFEGGGIKAYDKKNRLPGMSHIDYGVGVLTRRALARYPDGGMLDLATVYQDLLAVGDLAGYEVTERFYEIGSAAGIEELNRVLGGGAGGGRRE